MKELSIEEKAKRFDEALERAKIYYSTTDSVADTELIELIFPELKESDDERIRNLIYLSIEKGMGIPNDRDRKKALAWIEKQGEQKSTNKVEPKFKVGDTIRLKNSNAEYIIERISDSHYYGKGFSISIVGGNRDYELVEKKHVDKVEPKFKVGDWVVSPNGVYWHVDAIRDGRYQVSSDSGESADWPLDTNIYHKFTIQNAKDGDILEFGDHGRLVVGIVSFISKTTGRVDVYCLLEANNFKVGNYYALDTINPHPATKEQRDTLFAKMKEAGYEWDAEKKELHKIEQKQVINYPDNLSKDNWELIHEFVEKFGKIPKDEDELNVLVEYVLKRQNPAEWSEEDERIRSVIWNSLDMECLIAHGATTEKVLDWFDSLKDRVQPQTKQEWSEEDIVAINCAVDVLSRDLPSLAASIKRLKSLRPHNTWKPSNQELAAMLTAIGDEKQKGSDVANELQNIYQQLKKLKE